MVEEKMKFLKNEKLEKRVSKKIRRNFKRYFIAKILAYAVTIATVCFDFYICSLELQSGGNAEGVFILIVGTDLLPFVVVLLCIAAVMSGGSDVLGSRFNEKVEITEDELVISFNPLRRISEDSVYAEYHIAWDKISDLKYNARNLCLDIKGDYIYRAWEHTNTEQPKDYGRYNKIVQLYDVFDEMDQIKQEIQKRSGKIIRIRDPKN